MAELIGFHHVGVTVTDLDKSAAWYADVLGFEELFREESDERRASVMRFPGGSTGVGLVEHRSNDGTAFDPTRLGLDHLAFTVATQEGIEQWAQRLTTAGIEHSGVIEIPPGAILNFKDPDGIALALFWDR
ncbi:MAG: VOC family protein [Acidimicrobiales bacterium]